MKIELKKITVRELTDGYVNDQEEGGAWVWGQARHKTAYQREFIYKDEQRDAVVDTILKGYPLNVMYWAVRGDGTYELTAYLCEGEASEKLEWFKTINIAGEELRNAVYNGSWGSSAKKYFSKSGCPA